MVEFLFYFLYMWLGRGGGHAPPPSGHPIFDQLAISGDNSSVFYTPASAFLFN